MDRQRRRFPHALTLVAGLAIGWALAGQRPLTVKAGGGDRYADYAVTTGTVAIQYNDQSKIQSAQEAVFYLDYKDARLLATIPTLRQSLNKAQVIDEFIPRDLAADFKIDLATAASPHFVMTCGSLGYYGDGWSPLFVFETTTKQVAVYKIQSQSVGIKATAKFELLQVKSFAALPPLPGGGGVKP